MNKIISAQKAPSVRILLVSISILLFFTGCVNDLLVKNLQYSLETHPADLILSLAKNPGDSTLKSVITITGKLQKGNHKDYFVLFGEAFKQAAQPDMRLAAFFEKEESSITTASTTDEQVIKLLQQEYNAAIDRNVSILSRRFENMGARNFKISKSKAGIIMMDIPGEFVAEFPRYFDDFHCTGKLEFWATFDNRDILPALKQVNTYLKYAQVADTIDSAQTVNKTTKKVYMSKEDSVKEATLDKLAGVKEGGTSDTDAGSSDTYVWVDTDEQKRERFSKDNPLFSLLIPAEYQDEYDAIIPGKGPLIGRAFIKDTAKVNKLLAIEAVKARLPYNFKALWSSKVEKNNPEILELIAIKITMNGKPLLEGNEITEARKQKNDITENWDVNVQMNQHGASTWRRVTRANTGQSITIVLDDYVYSYPTVQGEIAGGNTQITGRFTAEEAECFANILTSGALALPVYLVEEKNKPEKFNAVVYRSFSI